MRMRDVDCGLKHRLSCAKQGRTRNSKRDSHDLLPISLAPGSDWAW